MKNKINDEYYKHIQTSKWRKKDKILCKKKNLDETREQTKTVINAEINAGLN